MFTNIEKWFKEKESTYADDIVMEYRHGEYIATARSSEAGILDPIGSGSTPLIAMLDLDNRLKGTE